MNYTLSRLNPTDFEHLIQSLMQKMLGYNSIIFGTGADGGREMTFEGKANYPNKVNGWSGEWIIQAKYKMQEDKIDEYNWVASQFKKEIIKLREMSKKPENYIFLTNVKLTGMKDTGGRDKIEKLKDQYKDVVKNIFIGGYDDICRYLDNNRDVATSYASFILSGDILMEILQVINSKYSIEKKENIQNKLCLFYLKEIETESTSKLIQAGDFANNNINIENIFIDLDIENNLNENRSKRTKSVSYIVKEGNSISRPINGHRKYVILGGAGAGKSTITQYLYLLYIAYFLKEVGKIDKSNIDSFIYESIENEITVPKSFRMPFKITLKDYAGWVIDQQERNKPHTILKYIIHKINFEADIEIEIDIIRKLFAKFSFIFIFDGLDEVPHNSNRGKIIENINHFVEVELFHANCDSIIIATTRPQGYTVEFNKEKYNHFYLSELTDNVCIKYLEKLLLKIEKDPTLRNNHLFTLKNALRSETTGRLMRSPLQATIMAILVRSGGEPSSNKYELFKQYYETIFKREKQKMVSPIINGYENHINKIHNKLGFKLQNESQNKENVYSNISIDEFENLIKEYLLEEEWEEIEIIKFVEEFKRTITERLVFISEVQTQKVGFIIRSLQEYFAANYYMDANDDTVKLRIRQIALSAYWKNTFLFCVGYIRLNKSHLIDHVFLVCQELNEDYNEVDIATVNQIVRSGSWIALDILIEGIFNDTPRNYNRFGSLLLELIQLPLIEEHYKFSILLNSIKERWIVDKLNPNHEIFKSQPKTLCAILIAFIKEGTDSLQRKCIALLEIVDERMHPWILSEMYTRQVLNSLFYIKFKESIIQYPGLTRSIIKRSLTTADSDTLLKLFEEYEDNSLEIKFIIEQFFLHIFSSYVFNRKNIDVLNNILKKNIIRKTNMAFEKNVDYDFRLISDYSEKITVKYSELNITYILVDKKDKNIFKYFQEVSEKYDLKYFVSFFEYLINPSIENFNKFTLDLSIQPYYVIKIFKKIHCDWFFDYYISKWIKDFEDIPNSVGYIQNNINSEISIRNLQDNLFNCKDLRELLKFASSIQYTNRALDKSSTISCKYFEIYLRTWKNGYEDIDKTLYLKLLTDTNYFRKINTGDPYFPFITHVLVNFELNDDIDNYRLYSSLWIKFINSIPIADTYTIINESNCFTKFNINTGVYYSFAYFGFDHFLPKPFFNLLEIFLSFNSPNSYIRFFFKFILAYYADDYVDVNIGKYINKISFEKLYQTDYKETDDLSSKYALLLLSKDIPYSNIEEAVEKFQNILEKDHNIIKLVIVTIQRVELNSSWIVDLILKILPLIDLKLHKTNYIRSEYYSFLKKNIDIITPFNL